MVTFEPSAGNPYQKKSVKFDLDFNSSEGEHNRPTPTPTPKPTPTPTPKPTHRPTPTPTPKHDEDHGRFDLRKFGDDFRSRFDNFFKFPKPLFQSPLKLFLFI